VVPIIMEAVGCRSVIDVGCGVGTWLSVFLEHGVTDVQGIDGPYVDVEALLIPRDHFVKADLSASLPRLDRRFDVALCLEVAEHLPASSTENLVEALTSYSPVVVFSASVPFQEGTGHINEQWLEYWIERFSNHGYVAIDYLRPKIWNNPAVEWWYAQNTIFYVNERALAEYPRLQDAQNRGWCGNSPPSLVHPKFLLHKERRLTGVPLKEVWSNALSRTWSAVSRRAKKLLPPQ
jgi:SAM-dependent methyltransferase